MTDDKMVIIFPPGEGVNDDGDDDEDDDDGDDDEDDVDGDGDHLSYSRRRTVEEGK